ncbi:unnamed protein product [Chilo suppressalis]|uniref:Pyruvate kinase n=1 Tax=Chilo suppressalis TaxID=168631 RepID=A0ABN8BFE9_CHISP|nr:unnamed protein product [Chilo suppressalis]
MRRSSFHTDFSDPSCLTKPESKTIRTTIIATITDSSITAVDIQKMLEAGMNAVKFKLSHTTKGDKLQILSKLDKACLKCCTKYGVPDWPVSTSIELKTCIVKTGLLGSDKDYIYVKEGSQVILTNNLRDYNTCNEYKIFVDNACLTSEVNIHTEISIGQEEIIVICTEIVDEKSIQCLVTKGGRLFDLDYVSMRSVIRKRPTLGKIDFQIITFALQYQVHMLIINYVRHAETLKQIKKFIGPVVKRPFLISGICTQQGLDNIDEIAEESDAILLSREFLPFELDASKRLRLHLIQKWLGAKCQAFGKPYFLSGDILQDTMSNGYYTDREVSDATNALFDGVGGFILKNYHDIDCALEALNTLNTICQSTETYTDSKNSFLRVVDEIKLPLNAAEASMLACVIAAYQCQAGAIIIPTVSGTTARTLLRMNPDCLIITVCKHIRVNRLLKSCKNVVPLVYVEKPHNKWIYNVKAKVVFAVDYAVHRGWLKYGNTYVTLQRGREESSYCDMVRISPVTNYKRPTVECHEK